MIVCPVCGTDLRLESDGLASFCRCGDLYVVRPKKSRHARFWFRPSRVTYDGTSLVFGGFRTPLSPRELEEIVWGAVVRRVMSS